MSDSDDNISEIGDGKEIVSEIKECSIKNASVLTNTKLFAFDMDQTIVSVHTSGSLWHGDVKQFAIDNVTQCFLNLAPRLLEEGKYVAIVTYSDYFATPRSETKSPSATQADRDENEEDIPLIPRRKRRKKRSKPKEPSKPAGPVPDVNGEELAFLILKYAFTHHFQAAVDPAKEAKHVVDQIYIAAMNPRITKMRFRKKKVASVELPGLTKGQHDSIPSMFASSLGPIPKSEFEALKSGKSWHIDRVTRLIEKRKMDLVQDDELVLFDDDGANVLQAIKNNSEAINVARATGLTQVAWTRLLNRLKLASSCDANKLVKFVKRRVSEKNGATKLYVFEFELAILNKRFPLLGIHRRDDLRAFVHAHVNKCFVFKILPMLVRRSNVGLVTYSDKRMSTEHAKREKRKSAERAKSSTDGVDDGVVDSVDDVVSGEELVHLTLQYALEKLYSKNSEIPTAEVRQMASHVASQVYVAARHPAYFNMDIKAGSRQIIPQDEMEFKGNQNAGKFASSLGGVGAMTQCGIKKVSSSEPHVPCVSPESEQSMTWHIGQLVRLAAKGSGRTILPRNVLLFSNHKAVVRSAVEKGYPTVQMM